MYTNILIPTDGSELAGKAIPHGIALAKRVGAKVTGMTVLQPFHTLTTDTQMIEDTPAQYKARMKEHADKNFLAPSPTQHEQRASHTIQSMSSMSIPTRRSSRPRSRKAVTLSSWPRTAATASPRSSSAARRSRYSRIPRSRYWCIDEPRGDSPGCVH